MGTEKIYLDYTQEELDRQYDQNVLVPDQPAYMEENRVRSGRVRSSLKCELNVPYGPAPDETLDFFPAAEPGGPVLVYHHGGAWRFSHKDEHSFVAECFVAAGVNVVIPNFSLAPTVSLDEIVGQNRAAVSWAARHAGDFSADPDRLYVCGHSSGGHLAAMMMGTDWGATFGLSGDLIKGAVLLSGIYDLEHVRLSYRNQYLFLDESSALRNSPIHHIPAVDFPLIIAYGEREHPEFKRQSEAFRTAWAAAGKSAAKKIVLDLNHFEMERELAGEESPVFRAAQEMMGF